MIYIGSTYIVESESGEQERYQASMNTQTLILAILNFGDATGYEIKKQSTDGAFSYFVDVSFGSIYPALTRLEARGLVTAKTEAQTGKPDKKVYSITEAGRAEFLDTLAQPVLPDKFRSEFLLVAMCAELTSKRVIAQALDNHLSSVEADLQAILDVPEECMAGESGQVTGTKWIADFGIHLKTAAIDFLKNNREQLIEIARDEAPSKQAAE